MPSQKQIDHEKFTAEKIITLCGEATQFARFGDPNQREPDIIFDGSDRLGIEVTFAYYRGDEDDPTFYAQEIWDFVENPTFEQGVHRIVDPKTGTPKVLDPTIYLSDRLQARCQEALDDKCQKTYLGVQRTWLGMYLYALLTEPHELDEVAQRLVIPSVNPFDRIFLLHRVNSQYRALQIFPTRTTYT